MTLVMGVDPGTNGALALYDSESGYLQVYDMPAWYMLVNKKTRKRVDAVGLWELFETAKLMGVKLVVVEAIASRGGEGHGAGVTTGYGAGLIYMACVGNRIPIETVQASVWKRLMALPGKKPKDMTEKQAAAAILKRAEELFPEYRHLFRGPQGGLRIDRAEAAVLARYTADHALKAVDVSNIREFNFRKVEIEK